MNRKNLAVIVCAATFGALGLAPAVLAQEDDDSVFETVTVTAQKREQNIYDVPVSISAFTPEAMERQGITDLTDIGKFVPNLNVTGFSAGHVSSANPFIRGIRFSLATGLHVIAAHERRHLWQAWNVCRAGEQARGQRRETSA